MVVTGAACVQYAWLQMQAWPQPRAGACSAEDSARLLDVEAASRAKAASCLGHLAVRVTVLCVQCMSTLVDVLWVEGSAQERTMLRLQAGREWHILAG